MNLEAELQKQSTRRDAEKIARYVSVSRQRMAELMDIFFNGPYRMNQKASWPMNIVADRHPEMLRPYLKEMIDNLENDLHDTVRRNTVRVLQFIDIPGELLGKAADKCFQYLGSNDEPVGVKVFSMTVLFNICLREPGLANELKLLIEDQIDTGSAGFKSRGRKILTKLEALEEREQNHTP